MEFQEKCVAGDGFMLNLLSVLQMLAAKVQVAKVRPLYLHDDNARVSPMTETRLKMSKSEFQLWKEELCK